MSLFDNLIGDDNITICSCGSSEVATSDGWVICQVCNKKLSQAINFEEKFTGKNGNEGTYTNDIKSIEDESKIGKERMIAKKSFNSKKLSAKEKQIVAFRINAERWSNATSIKIKNRAEDFNKLKNFLIQNNKIFVISNNNLEDIVTNTINIFSPVRQIIKAKDKIRNHILKACLYLVLKKNELGITKLEFEKLFGDDISIGLQKISKAITELKTAFGKNKSFISVNATDKISLNEFVKIKSYFKDDINAKYFIKMKLNQLEVDDEELEKKIRNNIERLTKLFKTSEITYVILVALYQIDSELFNEERLEEISGVDAESLMRHYKKMSK